jgi:alpha-L-rhamnosidase
MKSESKDMFDWNGGASDGWSAQWIGFGWGQKCFLLRRSFRVGKPVKRAVVRATALGLFELRMNGQKVGSCELLPGWTDYRKRVYTHSFDVTDRMVSGENVIGSMVAPGWFAGYIGPFQDKGFYGRDPWFSAVLDMEYADGSIETLATDDLWKMAAGPHLSADLLMGEEYDARKEIPEWDSPGFDAREWKPAALFRPDEERLPEKIEPYPGLPVKTIAELPAQSVHEPRPGIYVFDLGQNMVGVVRLKVKAPSGSEILLKHGEMLNPDGTVYTENLRFAKAIDRYIAKGIGEETWQPRFTFHGFRYVEVHGLPAECRCLTGNQSEIGNHQSSIALSGQVWMSSLKETATFECSNEKVNKLFSNIQWSFRGNYLEIPTDCPQRDERLGWTGDTQMFIRSAAYLADIQPFFKKWLIDLHDAQHPDGGYPDIAPSMGRTNYASAGWSDAGIICPYILWQMYGDLEIIRPWWPRMKKFMNLICTDENRHNGPDAESFGDWLHFNSETPIRLIGLAYRAYDARLMTEMAAALGEEADHDFFEREAQKGRALFRSEFFQGPDLAVKSQTACALAIAMELVGGADLEKTKACLFQSLENHNGYLTTGFVGTAYLCPALTKAGRSDLAVQLLLNEGHPSWLYEVNNGATTIWERWNSWTEEDGFGNTGMNSFNHYAFGSICEWMFESLAGIRPASPGFQTLEIKPCFTDKLDYVKASYHSVQGRVSVAWERIGPSVELKIQTPVETEVHLPSGVQTVLAGTHVFTESLLQKRIGV